MNKPLNPFTENNLIDPNVARKAMDDFKRENDKVLKHKFSGQIKGNFLISIKDAVVRRFGTEILKYYDLRITNERMVDNSYEHVDYDICRHIVGIHRSNLIFETIDKRKEFEANYDYQERLVKKVIIQIKLRGYSSVYFRQRSIMQGENFIFFPVPYYLFVLCVRMSEILHTDKAKKDLPCYMTFATIVNKGAASLSLLEDNFLDNAYPICRGVIELYIKLLVLLNKPEVINWHNKFSEFDLYKSCISQTYTEEFNALYANRNYQGSKDKIDYLHYGWVDNISDYHSIVHTKPYSINGLINYLHYLYSNQDETFLNNLEVLFKMCHGYTHGNIGNSIYPLLHYFEISSMLYGTLEHTYRMLCESLGVTETINDVDILNELSEEYVKLEKQYSNRSTDNFNYYYKNQYKI